MRTLVSVSVLLAFFAFVGGVDAQKDKKKGAKAPINGKVTEVDTDKGFVTVTVISVNKKEKKESSIQYKVFDDTKVISDGGKTEVVGPEGLKNIKAGDMITITLNDDFRTVSIQVGGAGKK